MAELARANGIRVVFSSVLPVHNYTPQSQDLFAQRPPEKILELNRWLKDYCRRQRHVYLDYFSAMVDEKGLAETRTRGGRIAPKQSGLQDHGSAGRGCDSEALGTKP